jgi:hypothetical protein
MHIIRFLKFVIFLQNLKEHRFFLLNGSFIFCMLFTWLQDSKQLTVTNVKSLKMDEDVLAVSIGNSNSQVGKQHIAIALLDCTVKVALIHVHMIFAYLVFLYTTTTKPFILKQVGVG